MSKEMATVFNALSGPGGSGVSVTVKNFPVIALQKWPLVKWISWPDNPVQRDTDRRLRRAEHLHNPHQTHYNVNACVLKSNPQIGWKLDGHTRAADWERDPSCAPPFVYVTVYEVEDEAEAIALYKTFDNKAALETPVDKVSGAYRLLNWKPESHYLQCGNITNALRTAETLYTNPHGIPTPSQRRKSDIDAYDYVKLWEKELRLFDTIGPTGKRFKAFMFLAAIITLRVHGEKALKFWEKVQQDAGTKLESKWIDPVEMVNRLRAQPQRGQSPLVYAAARAVSCYESFCAGRDYKPSSAPRATDLSNYLNKRT